MTANELRQKYIAFFESKGHKQISSASLVPENDPSVLFTTAGMHPLVPYLTGETHPAGARLVDYQRCVRTGDIDEVGDKTHLTFFEMLGNWSLGDYFKDESISWSWEFLTDKKWLNLKPEMLAFSVFKGDENAPYDEEAYDKWLEMGALKSRIAKLDKEENWWPAGGKGVGPQGPDTEIFYWTGEKAAPEKFDPEDDRWVEIWNNVFMQFSKDESGKLTPLPQKNVDTGMGFERTVAVLQGTSSVYETELFSGILDKISELAGEDYNEFDDDAPSMRIIADHVRSAVMIIADGVIPSNKDQGYILRRLIRRAIRHARKFNIDSKDLVKPLVDEVIASLGEAYPELVEKREQIIIVLSTEAAKFEKSIQKGLKQIEKIWQQKQEVTGEDAFDLYQSYGFPLELTEEIAFDYGQEVDRDKFEEQFKKHQDLSRAGAGQKFKGGLVDDSAETAKLHTATHLLHQALRQVLGNHVEQRGSNITHDRLRFDFSHDKKLTDEEKQKVEDIVNAKIKEALPVHQELLTVKEAKKRGAIGLFEDKYATLGDKIKVYFVGDFSAEICGGPHVTNTSELGVFKIKKEEASSAGIRRIKAILT
ncbi:MAG: alanine--tRNA ligase [Patescibacteria group bacterium]|nr:alanine--tRNA ligase [Patescibacteria group bacterium]